MARKKKEIELPQITQEELIQQKAIGEIARDAFLDFGNYISFFFLAILFNYSKFV